MCRATFQTWPASVAGHAWQQCTSSECRAAGQSGAGAGTLVRSLPTTSFRMAHRLTLFSFCFGVGSRSRRCGGGPSALRFGQWSCEVDEYTVNGYYRGVLSAGVCSRSVCIAEHNSVQVPAFDDQYAWLTESTTKRQVFTRSSRCRPVSWPCHPGCDRSCRWLSSSRPSRLQHQRKTSGGCCCSRRTPRRRLSRTCVACHPDR